MQNPQIAPLGEWIDVFLIDRRSMGLAQGTLRFYRGKLGAFQAWFQEQSLESVEDLAPTHLRQYLLYLQDTGHAPGGVHAYFRAVKAFLRFYENEVEPVNWRNPIRKVKAPKVPIEPLEPVSSASVLAMLDACKKGTFCGDRNQAIILALLDTGARAMEFLGISLEDVDQESGEILIRRGKGRKPRAVYLGKRSRAALRTYLAHRDDDQPALWVTDQLTPLTYNGLRSIISRCAKTAGVEHSSPHDFRRAFAIGMLRNGVDLITLSRLMGHTSLLVLQRYLCQVTEDLHTAHVKSSPVDRLSV